jgi:hypothetical protein
VTIVAFEFAVASASASAVPVSVHVSVTVPEPEPEFARVPELAVETATASLPSDLDYQDCCSQPTNRRHLTLAGVLFWASFVSYSIPIQPSVCSIHPVAVVDDVVIERIAVVAA